MPDDRPPDRARVVSSVRVERSGAHDNVTVWNRGGYAGGLIVCAGDGERIARMLDPERDEPSASWPLGEG
jgi:hypothetical protein